MFVEFARPLPYECSSCPRIGFEDAQGGPALEIPAIVNAHIELTSRSEICTAPILILNFVLNGINPSGSPARVMQALLQPYIPAKDLHYHEIIFDFGTDEKFKRHEKLMGKLVNEFFAGIFVSGLEEILKGATLWMLVFGHMVHKTESFKRFTSCVKHHDIENAFAFGAEGLHVCLTTPFIAAYVERVLIEGFLVQEVMPSLLVGKLHIDDKSSTTVSTYTFFDENQRPWGSALPLQCSSCKCLRQWKCISPLISDNGSVVKFTCSGRLSRENQGAGGSGWLIYTPEVEPGV
ncbi:uncharacterized protein EDB91DRAFT_1078622 [Suillus paluster]|uniref:uncharacterized protein n=1 Tax=Suillus paluster TaxID=48578 RepID=UPI001B86E62E|nr:uncharacterized protein EDB91DRAFT_1078622 [Suillus paluster]KAG1750612.1 hypothetical protein EDB91DRAFT_1078622 [Suillus paluster]